MILGEKLHTMEIDTGALVSVISKTTYQCEFKEYELQESSVRLTTYGGEPLSVLGEIVINVSHGDNKAQLPLLVVDKDGPSLLGRNWLVCFHLDWNVIYKVQHSKVSNILGICNRRITDQRIADLRITGLLLETQFGG